MKMIIFNVLIVVLCRLSFAQENHVHHKMNMQDSTSYGMMNMEMNNHKHEMSSGVLLTAPMSMEGSGTSWHPESSPMYMSMYSSDNWMFMLHGNVKAGYTQQGGLRGEKAFTAPNWIMGMAQRKVGINSQIMFRIMMSIDRITEGGNGYPLLFQTGEEWKGEHLVDKQHPHDLFSEISAAFSNKFSNKFSGYIYVGYPGEPALGPPAFMHRPSAMYDPNAPISHHWQDATHITFGTATFGFVYNSNLKIEGSIFTGKEPDENRYNFDKPLFDSYSGRISFNPNEQFALQVSTGLIKNPEGHGADVKRTTASVLFSKKINNQSNFDNSFVWGMNDDSHNKNHSFLIESAYTFYRNAFYTRLEFVQKSINELGIFSANPQKENITSYTFGYNRNLFSYCGMDFNSGIQGTLYSISDFLKNFYGNNIFSFQVYIEIHPSILQN